MRIGIRGASKATIELKEKLSPAHQIIDVKNNQNEELDVLFVMDYTWNDTVEYYANQSIPVVVNAVEQSLEQQILSNQIDQQKTLFGMNLLPTFVDRSLAEMTRLEESDSGAMESIMEDLGWQVKWVESRVGMVTPRVIFMIINEAFFTVQEGTASREDIDTGMKLGTAYPKGPFEWMNEVGIENVYLALEAIYNDTKDGRYKICPLLKKEYLKSLN